MPVVTMPNGDLVQFPDTMSRDQIGQFIASKFPGVYDAPEPSLGTIFTDSLARGGENVAATLKDDLPAYLASILGQDEYAVAQIEEGRARRQAAAEQYPTQYGSYEDVDGIGDAAGFITEKFAENVPILGGLGISALAGAVAAPVVGLGAATGAGVAGALGSYSLMAPESFAGIYEETGTLAPGAASIAGAINSALELVAPAQLLRSFSPSMRRGVVTAVLKKSGMQPSIAANAAKGVVKGVVTEGTTEGTQEAVNIAAEKFVGDNPMIFDSEDFKRIAESAVAGAAVGLPLGGIGGTGRGFTDRGQFRRDKIEAERLAAEQAEPVIEEPVVAEEGATPATTIPSDAAALKKWGLDNLGVSPGATILKPNGPLAGKNLTDPVQAAEVQAELKKYRATLKPESKIIPKVDAIIKALEPQGTFRAETKLKVPDGIPEPTVVGKKPPVTAAAATVTGADETVIDEELATRGFQKTETQEDIPADRPLWSKDLLGFVTNEYDITEAEVAGLTQTQMDTLLADAEANGAVFDGEMIVPEQTAQQAAPAAAEQAAPAEQEIDDGVGQVKDPEQAKVIFDELGVNEEESFNLTDVDFDALVRAAQAQRTEKASRPQEEVVAQKAPQAPQVKPVIEKPVVDEELSDAQIAALMAKFPDKETSQALRNLEKIRAADQQNKPATKKAAAKKAGTRLDTIEQAAKGATPAKKPVPTDLFLQLQKQIDKENAPDTRTEKEKKADQKARRAEALGQAEIEQDKLAGKRKRRPSEDKLAFKKKPLPDKALQELAVLKAATTPKKGATGGRQILANYLHAYETPEGALAAIAAESDADYTEIRTTKLDVTVVDARKAGAYINKSMDESVRKAFKENVDLVAEEIASIARRNAKEKTDAEARKVSKFGRSKTAEDLKKVGAGTKGANAVADKKKKEVAKLLSKLPTA